MGAIVAVQKPALDVSTIEQVLIKGDLSQLNQAERLNYYKTVCESLGLNPMTRPFEYITLSGKLTFYARKDCTDQLRSIHNISIKLASREVIDGIYVVTADATTPSGRVDSSTGAVPIENLKGESKANAYMKAETKAKRRVTLSICGLGMIDESEVESIPGAVIGEQAPVDPPELAAMFKDFSASKGKNIGKILQSLEDRLIGKHADAGAQVFNTISKAFSAKYPDKEKRTADAYHQLIRNMFDAAEELDKFKADTAAGAADGWEEGRE